MLLALALPLIALAQPTTPPPASSSFTPAPQQFAPIGEPPCSRCWPSGDPCNAPGGLCASKAVQYGSRSCISAPGCTVTGGSSTCCLTPKDSYPLLNPEQDCFDEGAFTSESACVANQVCRWLYFDACPFDAFGDHITGDGDEDGGGGSPIAAVLPFLFFCGCLCLCVICSIIPASIIRSARLRGEPDADVFIRNLYLTALSQGKDVRALREQGVRYEVQRDLATGQECFVDHVDRSVSFGKPAGDLRETGFKGEGGGGGYGPPPAVGSERVRRGSSRSLVRGPTFPCKVCGKPYASEEMATMHAQARHPESFGMNRMMM